MFRLVVWDFLGKISNQIIAFAVSLFLTRILNPSEFGIVGIALALVAFTTIFYDFGLKASIIQADQISQRQLSTIFFVNLFGGLMLFLLFFSLSGIIQRFYKIEGLANVIIAVGFLLILNSTASLPLALLARKLQFRKMAMLNFIAALIAGIFAVMMALSGWGVWSLIANTLINALLILTGAFMAAGWRPSLIVDLKCIQPLWRFGSTVFGIEVLESVFSRVDVFLIGKVFQATILGFYTRAQSLDGMVKQFSSGSLIAVVLPYFSKIKNDVEKLRGYYEQSLHLIAYASLFLTGMLYLISVDLFTLLFTAKWTYSGKLFQLIALAGFAYPVSALMVNVILAVGKTKAIVRLEVLKKMVLLPVFVFGLYGGIKVFLICWVAANWVIVLLNAFFVRRIIQVSFWSQLATIAKYIVAAVLAVLITFLFTRAVEGNLLYIMVLRGGIFFVSYMVINHVGKTAGSLYILEKSLNYLKGKDLFKTI